MRLPAVLCLALAAGCAGLFTRPEPPNVSLADLQVADVGLFEQRYRLRLRVQNPNDFALPIKGMRYTLAVNDREFAEGVSPESVTVPAFGEELIEVEAVSNLARVVDQMLELGGQRRSLSYRLSGSLSLGGGIGRMPFDYQGEVNLIPQTGR